MPLDRMNRCSPLCQGLRRPVALITTGKTDTAGIWFRTFHHSPLVSISATEPQRFRRFGCGSSLRRTGRGNPGPLYDTVACGSSESYRKNRCGNASWRYFPNRCAAGSGPGDSGTAGSARVETKREGREGETWNWRALNGNELKPVVRLGCFGRGGRDCGAVTDGALHGICDYLVVGERSKTVDKKKCQSGRAALLFIRQSWAGLTDGSGFGLACGPATGALGGPCRFCRNAGSKPDCCRRPRRGPGQSAPRSRPASDRPCGRSS